MGAKNHFNNPVVIILLLVVVGMGGYFLLNKNTSNTDVVQAPQVSPTPNPQQDQIDALQKEVETLKNQKPQVVVKEVPVKTGPDLPAIISQWRPRVAHIECQWNYTSGQLALDGFGSGYLKKVSDNLYWIVTNQHVVSYHTTDNRDLAPAVCYVKFPGTNEIYTITDKAKIFATDNPNVDIGFIVIDNPSYALQAMSLPNNYCSKTASVGEQVVVIGYPSIGSPTDVTATEGIISGYDNGYYITSAKVEHGNSGGIAVSLKNNCYLGIPTYVAAGELESLARIFDFKNFLNSQNPQ